MTNKFAFATQKIAWIQDKCYTWYNIHIGKKCHKQDGVILTINECEDGASNDNIVNKLIMLQPHSRCIIRSTHSQRMRLIHSLKIFKLFISIFFLQFTLLYGIILIMEIGVNLLPIYDVRNLGN